MRFFLEVISDAFVSEFPAVDSDEETGSRSMWQAQRLRVREQP
jgi:hypothetical protein